MLNYITLDDIQKFLFAMLAYGSGSALVAYALFRFLGRKWIENKFAQKLEQHKHQQAIELQRLRIKIDSMLSGVIKLQEKEFDLLPKAWEKLDEAHRLVAWFLSPFQESFDLERMDDAELDEFLQGAALAKSEQQRIRTSSCRNQTYSEITSWHRLAKVRVAVVELSEFIARNGIFFPLQLKDNLNKIRELLWSALMTKQVGMEVKDYKIQRQGWQKIKDEIEPLYKSVEVDIFQRLRSHSS
jgi:hypothetical protein